ncbi:MAG TPA: hypothetical protein VNU44_20265 [Bryobacteraceae bacterium]|nr:hypothetical protein [Bryobacteraceae bacterium]
MTKRQTRIAGFILIVLPCLGLLSLVTSSRWEALRGVDIVQLIATGACFGAGFMLILGRPSKD